MISKIKAWWGYLSTPQTRIRCVECFEDGVKVYGRYYCEERTLLLENSWRPIDPFGGECSTLEAAKERIDAHLEKSQNNTV